MGPTRAPNCGTVCKNGQKKCSKPRRRTPISILKNNSRREGQRTTPHATIRPLRKEATEKKKVAQESLASWHSSQQVPRTTPRGTQPGKKPPLPRSMTPTEAATNRPHQERPITRQARPSASGPTEQPKQLSDLVRKLPPLPSPTGPQTPRASTPPSPTVEVVLPHAPAHHTPPSQATQRGAKEENKQRQPTHPHNNHFHSHTKTGPAKPRRGRPNQTAPPPARQRRPQIWVIDRCGRNRSSKRGHTLPRTTQQLRLEALDPTVPAATTKQVRPLLLTPPPHSP